MRVLPGGEGINGVVTVLKNGAGGIEDGIGESDRLWKVDVERADEMFAVDVEIGDGDGSVVGDFAFESKAGLLHARGDEVGGKGGNVVGDAFGESCWETAGGCGDRATHERIRVVGEDLMVVVVGVVEKDLSVGDAIFGGDGGVVNLRNADVEHSITRANHQRMILAEGISESGTRAEVVGLEGNFAGGWEQRIRLKPGVGEGL